MASAPSTGRFISRDPVAGYTASPQSLNGYAYAMSNPVMRSDPTGMYPEGHSCLGSCRADGSPNMYPTGDSAPPKDKVDGGGRVSGADDLHTPGTCERQTGGGRLYADYRSDPRRNMYSVMLPNGILFNVFEHVTGVWLDYLNAFNAQAMVYEPGWIWVRNTLEMDTPLYHHEVGHILQANEMGVVAYQAKYVAAAIASGFNWSKNAFEIDANCRAGLPSDWHG